MNTDFLHYLPQDFHPLSKVWIYQASRLFLISEAMQLEEILKKFTDNWQSHGLPVKGYANLLFGRFLIFMADETATGVSGCSTDSSVRVVKEIEEKFKLSMFNRQQLAFVVKDDIQLLPLQQFNYAVENNFITPDTLYFNNIVATRQEMLNRWLIPVKESWLVKHLAVSR